MIRRVAKHIFLFMKKRMLGRHGCRFEENVSFDRSCKFEGYNLLSSATYLKNVEMGVYTYTGYGCYLAGVKIGRFTSIGPGVKTAIGRHPITTFVSTHPQFYSSNPPSRNSFLSESAFKEVEYAYSDRRDCYPIVIGNDVWIGANVTIIDGVTIGDGAIIGAGSVVLHDVEPYSVVVGVPAKEIKKRFTSEQIELLLKNKWWDKDQKWLKNNVKLFMDLAALEEELKNE